MEIKQVSFGRIRAYFIKTKYISTRSGHFCTYLRPMRPLLIVVSAPYHLVLLQLLIELILVHGQINSIQSLWSDPSVNLKPNFDQSKYALFVTSIKKRELSL